MTENSETGKVSEKEDLGTCDHEGCDDAADVIVYYRDQAMHLCKHHADVYVSEGDADYDPNYGWWDEDSETYISHKDWGK